MVSLAWFFSFSDEKKRLWELRWKCCPPKPLIYLLPFGIFILSNVYLFGNRVKIKFNFCFIKSAGNRSKQAQTALNSSDSKPFLF